MKEAAEYMGRSVQWLRAHSVNSNPEDPDFIPYFKTSSNKQGHVMFRRADLDKWINERYSHFFPQDEEQAVTKLNEAIAASSGS